MKSFHTPVPPDGRLSTADAPVLAIDSVDAEPTMMRPCRQYASWGRRRRNEGRRNRPGVTSIANRPEYPTEHRLGDCGCMGPDQSAPSPLDTVLCLIGGDLATGLNRRARAEGEDERRGNEQGEGNETEQKSRLTRLARVIPTFNRLQSARNPTQPAAFDRTVLKMMTAFSRPSNPSTVLISISPTSCARSTPRTCAIASMTTISPFKRLSSALICAAYGAMIPISLPLRSCN